MQAVVVDKIPSDLQVNGNRANIQYMKEGGIKLADPQINSNHTKMIGILVGANYCPHLHSEEGKLKSMKVHHSAGGILVVSC